MTQTACTCGRPSCPRAAVVLSDMAPDASGVHSADHDSIIELAGSAWSLALAVLRPGGTFVAKLLRGQQSAELAAALERRCRSVKEWAPPATHSDSSEYYVVARGVKPLRAGA